MLRIPDFAVGKDLMLRPGREGKLYAYIVQSGYIAEQARLEFDYYLKKKELVCIVARCLLLAAWI